MRKSAGGRWRNWTSIRRFMPDLAKQIERFLEELGRANVSAHTLRNYGSDLEQFLRYFTVKEQTCATTEAIDGLAIREWLGHLYEQRLTAVSMRRKLATVRSFFKFLVREGVVPTNVARLVRTPKAPKSLPRVMTAEQTNVLVDGVTSVAEKFERRQNRSFLLDDAPQCRCAKCPVWLGRHDLSNLPSPTVKVDIGLTDGTSATAPRRARQR